MIDPGIMQEKSRSESCLTSFYNFHGSEEKLFYGTTT